MAARLGRLQREIAKLADRAERRDNGGGEPVAAEPEKRSIGERIAP